MSLDIYVNNPKTGASMDMNWLRNPYGLCSWAESNYDYQTESQTPEQKSLWWVINHWNYDKSEQVDRKLFLNVVNRYGNVLINDLKQGHFFFTEQELKQFIFPHLTVLSWTKDTLPGVVIKHPVVQLGIPMEFFEHPCFGLSSKYRPNAHTLDRYQAWFQELMNFAEILRNPDAEFYCSN